MSGVRDATADRGGPSAPRSGPRLEAETSAGAPAPGAAGLDGAVGLESGSDAFDDAAMLGDGLGALGAGAGSAATSRAAAAGGVGIGGAGEGAGSSSTGAGFRGAIGAGRGRVAALSGTGAAGGGTSAGVRASHTTRDDCGAASPAEPAATTSAPRPRWIAPQHASGRATPTSVAVDTQRSIV